MFTKNEKILIVDLKTLGIDLDTIQSVLNALTTEEQRNQLDKALVKRYQKMGRVTREEVLKMEIMITQTPNNQ
jgi:hypothetical protein